VLVTVVQATTAREQQQGTDTNFHQEIAETPAEDAYYEAHGCYVSDGGSMYTCPNGAPPDPDANPGGFEIVSIGGISSR
jgi:hypothetical protein